MKNSHLLNAILYSNERYEKEKLNKSDIVELKEKCESEYLLEILFEYIESIENDTYRQDMLKLLCVVTQLYEEMKVKENFNVDIINQLEQANKEQYELLDILKHNLYIEQGTGKHKNIEVIGCSLGNQHSGKHYKIIKEWLENGK